MRVSSAPRQGWFPSARLGETWTVHFSSRSEKRFMLPHPLSSGLRPPPDGGVLQSPPETLAPLLNFGEVYVSSPLFLAGNELTNEPVHQILEARNGSWWHPIKPRLHYPLQGSREVLAICHVIYILDVHLCLIDP